MFRGVEASLIQRWGGVELKKFELKLEILRMGKCI